MKRIWFFLWIALIVSSCSFPGSGQAAPTQAATSTSLPAASSTPELSPTPSFTSTPEMTLTPSVTPSPIPFVPFEATAMVDNLNLRFNPGYLFGVILNVKQGTRFIVLGRSPGGEWIMVRSPSNMVGWVFAQLLETGGDLQSAPVIQPADVQILRGSVRDANGVPISGLQFAIVQGAGNLAPRNDAMTDVNGEFIAFMPSNSSGEWSVSYVAISCKSNMMDADCNCKDGICGTVDPVAKTVTLPLNEPLVFSWK